MVYQIDNHHVWIDLPSNLKVSKKTSFNTWPDGKDKWRRRTMGGFTERGCKWKEKHWQLGWALTCPHGQTRLALSTHDVIWSWVHPLLMVAGHPKRKQKSSAEEAQPGLHYLPAQQSKSPFTLPTQLQGQVSSTLIHYILIISDVFALRVIIKGTKNILFSPGRHFRSSILHKLDPLNSVDSQHYSASSHIRSTSQTSAGRWWDRQHYRPSNLPVT